MRRQGERVGDIDGRQRPLFLERVNFATAKEAVRLFHYTHKCTSAIVNYGVWESGQFRGVVMYSVGAASCIAKPFKLQNHEVRELVRVALNEPINPVSKIVAVSLRLFHRDYPDVKAIVSYADTAQGHSGTIYQASNWLYLGAKSYHAYVVNGKVEHPKSLHTRYKGKPGQSVAWLRANVDPNAQRIKTPPKHKYLYCFEEEMRREWAAKSQPYPNASVV